MIHTICSPLGRLRVQYQAQTRHPRLPYLGHVLQSHRSETTMEMASPPAQIELAMRFHLMISLSFFMVACFMRSIFGMLVLGLCLRKLDYVLVD